MTRQTVCILAMCHEDSKVQLCVRRSLTVGSRRVIGDFLHSVLEVEALVIPFA
jgi:hypothetical protein